MPQSVALETSLVLMSLEASLTLLFKSFHQYLFNLFHLKFILVLLLNLFHLRLHSLSRLQSVSLEALFTWLSHIDTFCLHFCNFIDSHRHFKFHSLWSSTSTIESSNLFFLHRTVLCNSNRAPSCAHRLLCISLSRSETRLSSVASVLTSFRCVRLDVFPLAFTSLVSAVDFPIATGTSATKLDHTGPCLASPRLTGSLQQLRPTCIYYRRCHYSKSTSASMFVLN
jgi:hypothetical protein